MKGLVYPPRIESAIPNDVAPPSGWLVQYKYNDSRLLLKVFSDSHVEFWSRHGEYLKYSPHVDLLKQVLKLPFERPFVLDGGLLHFKHCALKHSIVLWDVLVEGGEYFVGSCYSERYSRLWGKVEDDFVFKDFVLGKRLSSDIFVPENLNDVGVAWDVVHGVNDGFDSPFLEGLVFKDPGGILEFGFRVNNNCNWLLKSRVCTGRHRF